MIEQETKQIEALKQDIKLDDDDIQKELEAVCFVFQYLSLTYTF